MGSSSLGIYMSALYTLYTSDHRKTIPGDTRENVYTNIKKYSQQDNSRIIKTLMIVKKQSH